jgi:hypothetical protein
MLRDLSNSRRLQKKRNGKLNLSDFVYVLENENGQERVSTRREEVVMNTDPVDLEDFRPTLDQRFL